MSDTLEKDPLAVVLDAIEDARAASAATDHGNADWQAALDCVEQLLLMRLGKMEEAP